MLHQKVRFAIKLIEDILAQKDKRVGVACSFGKDSLVLLHICQQVDPNVEVFSFVSDTEFQETYDFIEQVVRDMSLNYKPVHFNQLEYYQQTGRCCNEKKVEAAKSALEDYDIWISGIRKSECNHRAMMDYFEINENIKKLNPLLDFTELDIWRYIACYQLPSHPLYKQGYRSLGCKLCSTMPTSDEEPERAGRWRGTSNEGGECGIHYIKKV